MRMTAIALDLGEILIDSILTMIAAIFRFRLRSANAHFVLTFFASHLFNPRFLAARSRNLYVDLFLLRARKTPAIEKYTCDDRHNYY
jgi:hypothetical protein